MPSFDSSRRRLRLSDGHVAALGYLANGEDVPGELGGAVAELETAGLADPPGELNPLAEALVEALGDPLLVAHIEVTGEHGQTIHGIVAGREIVFAHEGWPGVDESEYVPVEPSTLVWSLARSVGLISRPVTAAGVSEITTTMGTVDAVFEALGSSGATSVDEAKKHASAALGAVAEPARSALVDVITALNSSWRITTTWAAGAEVRCIAVWDCGPYGYWHRELPAEPIREGEVGPESTLRIVPVTAARLWELLGDLLPDVLG
ncbi:MAG: hypothetical protein QOD41_746 [Cryptosporangiaceae bacterium]|jgi:hypothetical protein|nr:hypothetical protein [Cryptosporangiaceae bacterium]